MVVLADRVRHAGHAADGQVGQRAARAVHQRHVLDVPVLRVPGPAGKRGMLPVGVSVDVVQAGLDVDRAVAELRAGDQRPDVQLVLEKAVHALPVVALGVPEEVAEIAAGRRGCLLAAGASARCRPPALAGPRPTMPPGRSETSANS